MLNFNRETSKKIYKNKFTVKQTNSIACNGPKQRHLEIHVHSRIPQQINKRTTWDEFHLCHDSIYKQQRFKRQHNTIKINSAKGQRTKLNQTPNVKCALVQNKTMSCSVCLHHAINPNCSFWKTWKLWTKARIEGMRNFPSSESFSIDT